MPVLGAPKIAASRTPTYPFAHTAASANSQDAALPSLPVLLPWIDGFWLAGVFALSLRSLGGWWLIRRLCASANTADS